MRRNKKAIKIKVGVFIFGGLVCLAASVFFLGKNQTFFSLTHLYQVRFASADGLFAGSVVTLNGIPVGNVLTLNLIADRGEVTARIAVLRKFTDFITSKSSASLLTKGLLGDKYIAISTQGREGQKLKPGSIIPSPAEPGLMKWLGSSTSAQTISSILEEFSHLLSRLNRENTLHNMSAFFSPKNALAVSEILQSLNNILKKIDKGEGTAGALINNKNIYNSMLSLLGKRPYHKYIPNLINDLKKK